MAGNSIQFNSIILYHRKVIKYKVSMQSVLIKA